MLRKLLLAFGICLLIGNSVSAETPKFSISSKPAFPNKFEPERFRVELAPGTSTQETLKLINPTDNSLQYLLTGVDQMNDDKEKPSFRLSTDTQTGAGLWIIPESRKVTLGPRETALINFSILVPQDAAPKDYLAGLSIEIQNVGTSKQKGLDVSVSIRKVERINIKVTHDPQPVEKMPPPSIPWTQIYFLVSLGIFILAVLYIGFSQLKKHRAKRRANKAATGHPEKPAHPSHHEKK
jgi:hypothetical protein